MKIYLLTQTACVGWDTYSSCVVIAASERDARRMHPDGGDLLPRTINEGDGPWGVGVSWPDDPDEVTVTLLGEAHDDHYEARVVCASYHAG